MTQADWIEYVFFFYNKFLKSKGELFIFRICGEKRNTFMARKEELVNWTLII